MTLRERKKSRKAEKNSKRRVIAKNSTQKESVKFSYYEIAEFLLKNSFFSTELRHLVVSIFICMVTERWLTVQIPLKFETIVSKYYEKNVVSNVAMPIFELGFYKIMAMTARHLQWYFYDGNACASFSKTLSTKLCRKVHNLPISWHLSKSSGKIPELINKGTVAVERIIDISVFWFIPTVFEAIFVIYILNSRYGTVFSGGALIMVICFAICTFWFNTRFQDACKKKDDSNKEKDEILADGLTNFETVKLFTNEEFEVKKYEESMKKFASYRKNADFYGIGIGFSQHICVFTASTLLMYITASKISLGTMDTAALITISSLLNQLREPLGVSFYFCKALGEHFQNLQKIMKILKMENFIDQPDAKIATFENPSIQFQDVNFSYVNGRQILKNINLEIESGQKVALVGDTGSGKSTLVKLLYRFYKPDSGIIAVNNQSISEMTLKSLRSKMSIVPQDCCLFNDSIRTNIRYARLSASDHEVENAAKIAKLDQAIAKMKNGYETIVGARGLKLSGGEKQRLAIARAMIKRPEIVVLDEATSSLDSITEAEVMRDANEILKGKTTIIIAHRLSTIQKCDKIVVMKDGEILESGTHKELIQKKSAYHKLWNAQKDISN